MTITASTLPTSPAAPADRRRFTRVRVTEPVTALIGRGSGTLVDLSANGARIRHASPVPLRSSVRVTFEWRGRRFEAPAQVLASRVASLGGRTQFESRLRFLSLTDASRDVLAKALTDLLDLDLRKWVANLHGWNDEGTQENDAAAASGYIRCRYSGGRWQQTPTRDPKPPLDGFTVPAGTTPAEIRALCRTWETSDDEGRRLVTRMAEAVVAAAGGRVT